MAEVVCDETGTHVGTPQVRPQADGVHFQVHNDRGEPLAFAILRPLGSAGNIGFGGDNAPSGTSEIVNQVTPGVTSVGCRSADQLGDQGIFQPLEIVDEDGIWVSTTLGCDYSTSSNPLYGAGAKGSTDVIEAARQHFQGINPDDVVEVAGYPEGLSPAVRVVREGRVIATAYYLSDDQGGWLLDRATFCSDSGLTG